VTAAVQVVFAFAIILRPSRGLALAGMIGSLALVVLWVASRGGLPVWPAVGMSGCRR